MKQRKWVFPLLCLAGAVFIWGCGSYNQDSFLRSDEGNGAAIRIENSDGLKTTLGDYFNREYMFVDFSRAG